MIVGLGCIILPWIKEKMIHGRVVQIELWRTNENGKRLELLRQLSEEERKTISQIFRKYPHKVNKSGKKKVTCADIALRVIYKKQKQVLYLTKDDNCCFVMRDKTKGVVLKKEEAQRVNNIIFK